MNQVQNNSLFLPEEKKRWFVEDRFGMFIHFGLYAMAARHEWVQSFEKIPAERYNRYFENFDPDLYDPRRLAHMAREAGMRYAVMTAKHHDGFCLWDSAETDFKSTNTPYGRDLIGPYVEAFRDEGLKVGLYYSLLDWHHPHFPVDYYHPLRDEPDIEALNQGRDIRLYADYMRRQVTELLTGFGKIDVLWCDYSYPTLSYRGVPGKGHAHWESERLIRLIRSLQPDIMLNNRLDIIAISDEAPDFVTPEQFMPDEAPTYEQKPAIWENGHTFSGSWGYFRDEESWKSPEQLIQLLVDSVSRGGNLLMNVGPTGRGDLDERAEAALAVYGKWIAHHARSVIGCGSAPGFEAPRDCRLTRRADKLYIHVFNWPFRHLHLRGYAGRVRYAQLLHDGSEIIWLDENSHTEAYVGVEVRPGDLVLELPVKKPDVVVPVIELILDT